MLPNRMTSDKKVIHWGPYGTHSIGRDDQCEYNGCTGYKVSYSRHCHRHSR